MVPKKGAMYKRMKANNSNGVTEIKLGAFFPLQETHSDFFSYWFHIEKKIFFGYNLVFYSLIKATRFFKNYFVFFKKVMGKILLTA